MGQRLTAGWAQRRLFWAFYGATPPTEVLRAYGAEAPARGGGRALPGGASALIPGEVQVRRAARGKSRAEARPTMPPRDCSPHKLSLSRPALRL
jgi:hypothetical protein